MNRWEKILGLVRSPWAIFALAVVALLAVVWRLNAARGELQAARDAASLAAAEAELRAAGELVAEREEAEGLRRRLAETSAELRAAVARAQALARTARPVRVVRARTEPGPAAGAPRVDAGPTEAPPSPCLLAAGDLGEIRVEEVTLETQEGAQVILGRAEAWRASDPPARLFGGPWAASLSGVTSLGPEGPGRSPGWGGGAGVLVGRGGAVPALALSPPPWHGLELVAQGGARTDGEWAAGLTLLWRP